VLFAILAGPRYMKDSMKKRKGMSAGSLTYVRRKSPNPGAKPIEGPQSRKHPEV